MTLLLTLATGLWADDISPEQAQQIAAQAMASFGGVSSRQAKARQGLQPQSPVLAYSARSLQDRTAFYIFNSAEREDGFVIVSADDVTPSPVLGFCDHGSFDYNQAPCCLKDLLEQYEAQIAYLRENPGAAKVRKRDGFIISYGQEVVAPFLQTQWNQDAPYNNFCPIVDGQSGRSYTGCTATAMAQILAYWKYPKEGRGSCHYSWNPTAESPRYDYGGVFTGHVYDWDNMLGSYGGDYTETQANAVARLMNDVGTSMKMCYSNFDYGSVPQGNVIWSMIKFFDYDPDSIRTIIRDIDSTYVKTYPDFDNQLKKELDARRPIWLSTAIGMSVMSKHAVVLDGYTDEDYFHLNFGWGGSCDGYYKTALIDIDAQYPFLRKMMPHIEQTAIMGICPAHSFKQGDAYYCPRGDEAILVCATNKGEVVIPASVTDEHGKSYPVTAVNTTAFCDNDSITSVSLPESLQSIGSQAFIDCTSLKSVNIPASIKTVQEAAFQNCTSLEDVNLEEGVERIGNGAFYFCTGLKEITLPATLTSIGDSAFIHDSALETVNDGYGVVRVGNYAFHGCKQLANFNFGPVRYIRDFAFSNCKFEYPYLNNVQIIGNQAFWNNPIKSIEFNALEFLGDRVFNHDAQSDNTVTDFRLGAQAVVQSLSGLPPSLTKIEIDAGNPQYTAVNNIIYSKDMTSLVYASCMYYDSDARQDLYRTTLDIPESVTRIGRGAIHSNWGWDAYTKLTEVTIPSSVTAIDTLAFADCYSIQKVYNHATVPQPLEGLIFGGTPAVLYVPEGCRDAYVAAEGWKDMQIYEDLPIPNYDEEDDYTVDDEETRVNGVRVHSQNSASDVWTYEVLFNSKPELTYEKEPTWDGQMAVSNILLTADCELEMVLNWRPYPEEQPAKLSVVDLKMLEFFYDEESDGIETVSSGNNSSAVRFRVNGRTIDISGLKTGDDVVLYALDGTVVVSATSNDDGRASITVPGGSAVTYVLKAGEASFKIRNK